MSTLAVHSKEYEIILHTSGTYITHNNFDKYLLLVRTRAISFLFFFFFLTPPGRDFSCLLGLKILAKRYASLREQVRIFAQLEEANCRTGRCKRGAIDTTAGVCSHSPRLCIRILSLRGCEKTRCTCHRASSASSVFLAFDITHV